MLPVTFRALKEMHVKTVERVLEQSKPEYADVAAPGKIRLLSEDIEIALDTWRPPPPEIILGLGFKDTIPPYEEAEEEDVCASRSGPRCKGS
jgi:hypothetical protein